MRVAEIRSTTEQGERDRELRSLRQQHSHQVQGLQQIIQSQMCRLHEKDQALKQKDETIAAGQQQLRQQINENYQVEREKNQAIEGKGRLEREKNQERMRLERQLGRVNQQLEESERVIAQFQRRIAELEQLRSATDTTSRSKERSSITAGVTVVNGRSLAMKSQRMHVPLYDHYRTGKLNFRQPPQGELRMVYLNPTEKYGFRLQVSV